VQWPTGPQASDVMGAPGVGLKMTPLRLKNTVICGFDVIKRNLRSAAIINSKLFPAIYQLARGRHIGIYFTIAAPPP